MGLDKARKVKESKKREIENKVKELVAKRQKVMESAEKEGASNDAEVESLKT